jgi:hypothetical protein
MLPALPVLALGLADEWFFYSGAGLLLCVLVGNLGTRLELTDSHAVVRTFRAVRVPWSSVTEVRAGTWWQGGIVLKTASYNEIRAAAPCSWWGGPPDPEQVAEVERWWIDHRGPSWAPPPPFVHRSPAPRARYRTSTLATPLAIVGLLVAAVNGAALAWPAGTYSALGVEVVEPELDHLGWMVLAAVTAGLALGGAWAVQAFRILTREPPPPRGPDAPRRPATRPLVIFAATGAATAAAQWLGVVPAVLALSMIAVGLAAGVCGPPLAVAVRRFEQRTGHTVMSAYPFSRGLGLESRPPAA